MKLFVTGILLILLGGCSRGPVAVSAPVKSQTSGEGSLATALKKVEAYYAPFLPRMADEYTRLESVRATETELRLESTLTDTLKSELDLKLVDTTLRPQLEDQARKMENLNSLLQAGATLVYLYKDKEGAHVAEIRIKPEAAAKTALSPDNAMANAKHVYQWYVQHMVNFDSSIGALYTDAPTISMTRNYPDGTSQTKTPPEWRSKRFIVTTMAAAKQRGDAVRFSGEEYEQIGDDKVRIKAKQYSVSSGSWSDVTLLVVRVGDKWLIAEDRTVSEMPENTVQAK
jgi:hypothetical protein